MPLGILLRLKSTGFIFSVQMVLYGSLTIELVQLFSKKGSFDIDDLILNTIGGLLGFIITNVILKRTYSFKQSTS